MKRYETFLNKDCGRPFADIEEHANGGLVMYDDAMEEIARLNARVAELEAVLTEARSWIGDGEDSICSFVYPEQCSSDYVEMVNRVDSALSKGGAV